MNTYCIYIHINRINKKVYIGQTKHGQNPNKRWQNGQGYKENILFYSDIKKYGWNTGFDHQILFNNLSLEEANKKEVELISLYESDQPSYGYNLTRGGGNSQSSKKINTPPVVSMKDGILKMSHDRAEEALRYKNKYTKYFNHFVFGGNFLQ